VGGISVGVFFFLGGQGGVPGTPHGAACTGCGTSTDASPTISIAIKKMKMNLRVFILPSSREWTPRWMNQS
jgi:hypothetical protein